MAQYSKNSYQLTLDGNGGTVGGSAVKKEAVVYGSSFDEILSDGASEAGRKYYTFEGWYTAPTGGSKYSGSGNIMPASDITVYAHWTRSSSEVTYWDWDGRVIDSQEVMIGGNATPPADPVRPGYTFTGWDKPSTNIQAPITITAQYVKNSYQLALDGNGGIVDGNAVKKQAVAYGSSFDQILAESASEAGRKYYTFEGWYTAPTGGSKYSGSGNIMPASDITVYAHWVRSTSLVTYKDWNGTTLKIEEVAIGADATPPTDQPV
jgi:uncharacterized repeat protein (TIGR02543 family)